MSWYLISSGIDFQSVSPIRDGLDRIMSPRADNISLPRKLGAHAKRANSQRQVSSFKIHHLLRYLQTPGNKRQCRCNARDILLSSYPIGVTEPVSLHVILGFWLIAKSSKPFPRAWPLLGFHVPRPPSCLQCPHQLPICSSIPRVLKTIRKLR
jgi:hypothetical protein